MNLKDNYLGIKRDEWNTPIFRFTTVDRILHLIAKGQSTLVSPRKWKDPFENILSRMLFRKSDGDVFKHPLRDRVYGQCWTMTKETDAAWRMYIPAGNGVRLKTTIKKLHKSLERAQAAYVTMSCYIGRVEYKTEDELNAWFSDPQWVKEHLFSVGCRGQAESLLFKRKEFEPEQEVRLIYLEPHNMGDNDFHHYELNVSDVIEQITFDPRMEDDLYETYSSILRKLGYGGEVGKSTLYQIPKFEIPV
ncbi:MAG: DUF2971 domain-containing protein [Deltaproteobacteria bacterium]|nr:DUF2971 domain-containing protein [Deltaproteobacteria bacterium]